nr:MAG TPA: hypothetical protein [Caudoviricetes sp.]
MENGALSLHKHLAICICNWNSIHDSIIITTSIK